MKNGVGWKGRESESEGRGRPSRYCYSVRYIAIMAQIWGMDEWMHRACAAHYRDAFFFSPTFYENRFTIEIC